LVAERPDEQLAPNSPILSALPLYMAMRFAIDALRASTAFSPGCFDDHRRDGGGDQGEGGLARIGQVRSSDEPQTRSAADCGEHRKGAGQKMAHRVLCR
jgi:hypothetical protein